MHVATNIRAARQGIGMDLRTMSAKLTEVGRKISPSGISKIENGDRRVDVDDLAAIAYLLRTTPAALLTPPGDGVEVTGVPSRFLAEEIQAWVAGRVKLTPEDLLRYWKEERFNASSFVKRFEDALALYDQGQPGLTPREVYEERLVTQRARLELATGRLLQLDPLAIPNLD